MKTGIIAISLAAAVIAAACRAPLDVGNFSVDGQWRGTTRLTSGADSSAYTFTLNLKQDARHISGSGSIRTASDSASTSASGTWAYPTVILALTAPGYAPLGFNSQFVTRDTLSGTLTGSGFDGKTLKLIRQP